MLDEAVASTTGSVGDVLSAAGGRSFACVNARGASGELGHAELTGVDFLAESGNGIGGGTVANLASSGYGGGHIGEGCGWDCG